MLAFRLFCASQSAYKLLRDTCLTLPHISYLRHTEQYNHVFMPSILVQLSKVHRVDVVRDLYDSLSINGEARAKRGYDAQQQVSASAPVPRKYQDFLRHDENKTDLFCFLAEHNCNKPLACGKLLLATHGRSVMCSDPDYNTSHLQPCGQEEADTRMLLHVADMVNAGLAKVIGPWTQMLLFSQ